VYVHCWYEVEFDWDAQNTRHIARHGVRTAEAEHVLRNDPVVVKTMAGKTKKTPKFKSEAEEAEWWDRNPDFIADQFETAAGEGRILRGLPGRGATRSVTIRLATKDVETAQRQAAKMGLPYQTYIKSVLHQALERKRKTG